MGEVGGGEGMPAAAAKAGFGESEKGERVFKGEGQTWARAGSGVVAFKVGKLP